MIKGWFSRKRKIDMSKLPPIVAEMNGKIKSPHNCWNATQAYFGHAEIGITYQADMEAWLFRHTMPDTYKRCTPGTILVLRKMGELIHTAVYVDKGLLWHKHGCSGYWEFITEKDLRISYSSADHYEYRVMQEKT